MNFRKKTVMSKTARTFWLAAGAAALAGVVVLVVQLVLQYGILQTQASAQQQSGGRDQQAAQSSAASGDGTSPSPEPSASTSDNVAIAPPASSAPVPLDNKIITSARIVVVGDEVSPNVYKDRNPPGYYVSAFTAAGEIRHNSGCYVHWVVYNNGNPLVTDDSSCGLQGGWSTEFWPNGDYFDSGSVEVTASITTDWGAAAQAKVDFNVQ